MKISVFSSLKGLGYNIVRLGPRWPGLSEMYAYKGDYKSPDAVYNGSRKVLVYRGLDREERIALEEIATKRNLSFSYPLRIGDDRIMHSLDGEVNISAHRKNVAFHRLLLGKI